jgi:hypothetical protein
MTQKRNDPFIWATWLSKVMAGEQPCLWSAWFKAHHQNFPKAEGDFDFAQWNTEHTRLLTTTRIQLAQQPVDLRVEGRNAFQYRHSSGAILAGKPDIVAVYRDGVIVCDCKTGRPRLSDEIQVRIYMCILPRCFPEFAFCPIRGQVVYPDRQVDIAPGVSHRFEEHLDFFVNLIAAKDPPPKAPSASSCRFCEITLADCKDRIQVDRREAAAG